MTSKSDIEHWQINATVYKDRVEEIHYITDPARNIRRKPQTKVWQVERLLGRGGFGEVRLEKNTEDGRVRAVKRITTSTTLSSSECEKELKALLEFSKPKSREAAVFVDFFGWFKDGLDVFLAMEYVPLGDLEMNVASHSGTIPEIEARDITEQILSGLEIMHAESFAHRDLKPQNVLVVHGPPEWWVKLADFGLSKRLTEATAYYTRSGTQSYMAPEILDFLDTDVLNGEYTNAVDLWAVGCITYRLVTGVVPFPSGKSLIKYCENKSLFPYDPLFDSGIKSSGSKFIRELLVAYPKERPSASQAINHTWIISGSNAEKLITSVNDFGDDTIFNTTDLTLRSYTEDPFATYVFESPASAKTPPEGSDLGLNNAENLVNQRGTQGLISPEPTTDSPTLKHVILNSDRPESSDSQILQSQSRSEVVEYKASRPPKVPEGWKAKWNEFYEEWFFMNIYTKETQRERPIKPFHRPLRDKTHLHQPTSHFLSMRTKPVPKEQSHNTSLPAISRTSNSHDVETYDQQPRHPSSRPSSNLSSHPSSYPSSRHTSRKDEDTNTSRSYSEEEQQNPKPISEATSNPLLPKNQQLTETPSNVPLPASITATVPPQVAVPIVLSEATNSAEDGNSWNHNVFDSVSVVSVSDQQTAEVRADEFFSIWMRKTERFFNTLRRYPVNPKTMVKVAIIDTGIDLEHPVLRPFHAKHQIGLCWDFVRGTAQITDSTGHGTHCAHLLLKTAPNAIIFVARVFEEAKAVEATIPLIEAAIRKAVDEWKVDIISMSFSFHDFHDVISDAISHAANEKVLLFGAASNYSHNFSNRVGFPARLGPVICIRSNTWEGIKSNFSPDGQAMSMNFSIIGEALKAATTQRRRDDPEEKRENGTSCATPIAAGVAALILEFARITEKPGVFYHERLKLLPGMRAVIADCMTDKDVSQGSYRYIKPWLLFGGHNGKKMDTNKISWEIDLALTNST